MAASSSSSSGFGGLFAVWLYDTNGVRVALVDVPVYTNYPFVTQTIPPLVTYLGNYYVWSNVKWFYEQVTPFAATADVGAPLLSVVCNPQN